MISPNIIDKCIKLILQSKTPLIILGSQAMLNVNKVKHIKEALNFFKIPFYCSGMVFFFIFKYFIKYKILQQRREDYQKMH